MQSSTYPGDVLMSIKQTPTPLNTLFFSEFNQNLLQRAIRQAMYNKHQLRIDKQNKDDLLAIMRVVFINNSAQPYTDICPQVKLMNDMVIKTAIGQIATGVAQYFGYIHDIQASPAPPAIPVNTSVYGNKIDYNTQIGF